MQRPCDGLIPVQGVLPTAYRIKKLKNGQGLKGCRAIERERDIIEKFSTRIYKSHANLHAQVLIAVHLNISRIFF
jgi:hypothetical protein